MTPTILDPASGSRMMYFDAEDQRVLFGDIRQESHILCDGRALEIKPAMLMDFAALPFADRSFKMVVFDPPHLLRAGPKSWQTAKYGKLDADWQETLTKGFAECFRVLDDYGTLVFKWNETQIKVREILALTDRKPVCGHQSGLRSNTHWIVFLKEPA